MSACTRQQPFYANLLIRIDLQCTYTCEKRLSLFYKALTRGGEYVTQFIATNSELRSLNHPLRVIRTHPYTAWNGQWYCGGHDVSPISSATCWITA